MLWQNEFVTRKLELNIYHIERSISMQNTNFLYNSRTHQTFFVSEITIFNSLRNTKINYKNGCFFITIQVNKNKSLFGAIVGDEVKLNSFGEEVYKYWLSLPSRYPELELIESILMPNHFHAIVRIHFRRSNHTNHLGFLMSRFKGATSFLYGKYKRAGTIEDIGQYLWQKDYWEEVVASEEQLKAQIRYVRANPRNWSRDRFGVCTCYTFGNLELLNNECVAFVASQGFSASALKPRRAKARCSDINVNGAFPFSTRAKSEHGALAPTTPSGVESPTTLSGVEHHSSLPPIISTFTSAQEREILRRALLNNRRIIQVVPQGIPPINELEPKLAAACQAGIALIISPQPSGSRLNKKVATWCNEYVLRHAIEIWLGDISNNGMLHSMLTALNITF